MKYLLLLSLSSCATLFEKKTHDLTVNSNIPGEVYIDGTLMGKTPLVLSLKANKSYTVQVKAKGYTSSTKMLNNKIGIHWVVLDVLGGLLPALIDLATGNWYTLETPVLNFHLEAEKK